MPVYEVPTQEVLIPLNSAEIKALREALGALDYNLVGATSAGDKLREALKAMGA